MMSDSSTSLKADSSQRSSARSTLGIAYIYRERERERELVSCCCCWHLLDEEGETEMNHSKKNKT
jgi:hypothetical protein